MAPRASFVFAVQTWLAQTPEQAKKAQTPGYLAAGMACRLPCSSICHVSNHPCLLVLGVGTVGSRHGERIAYPD